MPEDTLEEFSIAPGDRICVTGGGGYLGRHVAAALLARGLRVVITLRDIQKAGPVRASLQDYLGKDSLPLEFIEADLTSDNGWDLAAQSSRAIIHTASPFPDRPPKNPQHLVKLAAEGTERVLRAAAAHGTRRVVVTSSIAAVTMKLLEPGRLCYDESDWSDPEDPRTDAYALSKLNAERRAWALAEELGLEMTVINPGLAFGPPIGSSGATSIGVIQRFLKGRDPALPNAGFPCVDVRDAAEAHVLALLRNGACGLRIIAASETRTMVEIARVIAKQFPSRAIKTGAAPDMMVRAAAKFDPVLQNVLPHLGVAPEVSCDRAQTLLGLNFRPIDDSIAETSRVLMQQELAAAD
ncbi:NAD-dependent epimerase/dehydratase family protein [Leisingera sp. M658]|uniref:NAD-dependent epimerase/dehydratase family protein n=1 Tax=Leisingera sp. M658 TaxID=2867015 RepID=UPI0021A5DEEA|nr:NAD-dependent epimerase/dehydratase family protein [Leisingera sp. M658]UWQ77543.1 NAD-dependent epimerase/dehydratase family protein [Leisingera sp. M658]